MKLPKVVILISLVVAVALVYLIVRATDHTAEFRRALYSGNIAHVEQLLQAHPALANAQNMEFQGNKGSGWTPLHVAANLGDPELVKLLVRYGGKVDARDKGPPSPGDARRRRRCSRTARTSTPAVRMAAPHLIWPSSRSTIASPGCCANAAPENSPFTSPTGKSVLYNGG